MHYRYSLWKGVKRYPSRLFVATRTMHRAVIVLIVVVLAVLVNVPNYFGGTKNVSSVTPVPGENYQICNESAQYLTSPWTYDGLASGSQSYTVADYKALPGYGTTLPPLPSYISGEAPTTTAAMIFAPGSNTSLPAYDTPDSPIIYFYEGGAYNYIGEQTVSGDEFIGGSANGYAEPQFNDNNGAGGIDAGNDSYGYSGASLTLPSGANAGDTTITTSATLPNYANWITTADGNTYRIASTSGTSTTLDTGLANTESAGGTIWANVNQPLAEVSTAATRGQTTLTLTASSIPLVQYGSYVIGSDVYQVNAVSGNQTSGYTITINKGIDSDIAANTPLYYNSFAGDVSIEYLDIAHDLHTTTGTINIGSGWTVEHNNIHDGYRNPGEGVAIYGGDQSTVEYNCFARMGDYGVGGDGINDVVDYNEVLQTAYESDPGCGCSGAGKWWGSINADIVDNAFVEDGVGGDQTAIWLDNGNTGTLIEGNYFYKDAAQAISNETGFNMKVDDNLFQDGGWGSGTGGCGSNCDGAININSSGGMNIPDSRYENQILISNNQFINDWMGIDMWQSDQRSCLSSGEGWPIDSAYCSGGFPNTATTLANGQYYFSHMGDSLHGGYMGVDQPITAGDSTIYLRGSEAIDDQIGFADPATLTTSDRTDVTSAAFMAGTGTISATDSSSFPASGQLRVDTSAASGGGGFTGAVLSYTGNTGTGFTGVQFERGTGTLTGAITQIQPYKVTAETCTANDCAVTVTPAIASNVSPGTHVTNAGTCALYATSTSLPSGPLAPNSESYWDGCQWQVKNVSVTGNTFVYQPGYIAATAPPVGSATTTSCTAGNADACGTNFMAFQSGGQAPYYDETGGNAMMSSASFTGCPDWDPGCSTDPLANLNAGPTPAGATVNNGEAPGNNVWANNTYSGPWNWNDVYSYSGCWPLPVDGSNSLPNGDCGAIGFNTWQSSWQQDQGSTLNPLAVTLNGLTANQQIHGSAQPVGAYEDTVSPNTITSKLSVNGTQVGSNVVSAPYNFALNTLGYRDGSYTLQITGTDSQNNSSSDSVPVYISNGDLNGDGHVNLSDLAVMAAHWGQTDSNYGDGNITGQGTINISDLAVMAANWGWVQ